MEWVPHLDAPIQLYADGLQGMALFLRSTDFFLSSSLVLVLSVLGFAG